MFPGDPNLTLVAYGQGRSVVEYMIDEFGQERMPQLLATLGTGIGIDASLRNVYGFELDGLENRWRESIGADPYIEPTPGPTPTPNAEPTPGYKLLTLPPESSQPTPEPDDSADGEEVVKALDPAEIAEPTEAIEAEVAVDEKGTGDEPTESDSGDEAEEGAPGGVCSAPVAGSVDGTAGMWLLAVVGLVAGRRFLRRDG